MRRDIFPSGEKTVASSYLIMNTKQHLDLIGFLEHHDEHGDEEGEIEAGEGEAEFDYDPHSWLDLRHVDCCFPVLSIACAQAF